MGYHGVLTNKNNCSILISLEKRYVYTIHLNKVGYFLLNMLNKALFISKTVTNLRLSKRPNSILEKKTFELGDFFKCLI